MAGTQTDTPPTPPDRRRGSLADASTACSRRAAGCSIAPSAASSPSAAPARSSSSTARSPTSSTHAAARRRSLRGVPHAQGQDARRSAHPRRRRAAARRPPVLLLDTERVALQALFDMIRRFKVGYDVELHKRTLESGLLSLIGPHADRAARRTAPAIERLGPPSTRTRRARARRRSPAPGRAHATSASISSATPPRPPCSRTPCSRAARSPVSEPAAECLRVERGRPRYGIDLDDSVIPQEAGLNERAVSFTKGCYVGPGDGRAPVLQGQAQPPSARSAPVSAGAPGRSSSLLGERPVGRRRQRRPLPRARPDRARAGAPRGRARQRAERRRARRQRRGARAAVLLKAGRLRTPVGAVQGVRARAV